MEPIIAINFIKKQINPKCSSQELIKNLLPNITKFLICPKNYEDLKENFNSLFKPRNREKEKLVLSFNGFLPSGERVEITDDKTFNKNISLFFVCYTKKRKEQKSLLLPKIDTEELFKSESIEIQQETKEIENFNINEFLNLRNSVSMQIKEDTKKLGDATDLPPFSIRHSAFSIPRTNRLPTTGRRTTPSRGSTPRSSCSRSASRPPTAR